MDNISQALILTQFSSKNKLSIIKLDDSNICSPILVCKIERDGRTDDEISRIMQEYKMLFVKVTSSDIRVRYKIVE